MKVVGPDTSSGVTRTLTQRLLAISPRRADLVDAVFVITLLVLALLGFDSTFDNRTYLIIGAVGVLLGVVISHLVNVLRWHWLTAAVLSLLAFFLLGGAATLRQDLIAGVIPSLGTLAALTQMGIGGWKDLLTTVPPADGSGPFLVLPYLLGLFAAAASFTVARRTKSVLVAGLLPLLVLAVVLLLGDYTPSALELQGVGFAGVLLAWLAVRYNRLGLVSRSGTKSWVRILGAVLVSAISLSGGYFLGGLFPGSDTKRFVLRSVVQPPVDMNEYPSPLSGFRKYSSSRTKLLFEQPLLRIEGVEKGTLLRINAMDTYTGLAWSAARDQTNSVNGFRRVGTNLPPVVEGEPKTIKVTILEAYAKNVDVNVWVPNLGPATSVGFSPTTASAHGQHLRYNLETGQALVPDRLVGDETISVSSVQMGMLEGEKFTPGERPSVPDEVTNFVAAELERIAPNTLDPSKRLTKVMRSLRDGFWSDGTKKGEGHYLPGHGVARLTGFFAEQPFVGSDEHYAASLALLANRIGFPARVVFGAIVPEKGEILGKHVTAWVEIRTAESGWVTIPPSLFIPSRDKSPDQRPAVQKDPDSAVVVPPPNPQRPPGSFDSSFQLDLSADRASKSIWSTILMVLLAVLRVVGPPVLVVAAIVSGLLGVKAFRRNRRKTRGSVAARMQGGWREIVDRTRDLGFAPAASWTRVEQARTTGAIELERLANRADAAIFSGQELADAQVDEYWVDVAVIRQELVTKLPKWRQWWVALNPRSLLPFT